MEGPKSYDPHSRLLPPESLLHLHQKVQRLLPGSKPRLWSPAQQGGAPGGGRGGRARATSRAWAWGPKSTLLGPRRVSLTSGRRLAPALAAPQREATFSKLLVRHLCFSSSFWMPSQARHAQGNRFQKKPTKQNPDVVLAPSLFQPCRDLCFSSTRGPKPEIEVRSLLRARRRGGPARFAELLVVRWPPLGPLVCRHHPISAFMVTWHSPRVCAFLLFSVSVCLFLCPNFSPFY